MFTLILITSLMSKFHHDLNIQPITSGFSTVQACEDAGNDIIKTYISYNAEVKATVKCIKVQ